MTYRPKATGKKERLISFLLALCAIALFAASGFVTRFAGIYQISSIVFAVISIEMYMKYVGSDYVYEAGDKSFKIYKISGKKSICVCSLDYEMSLSCVISNSEYEANKSEYPKTDFNVNYAKNLAPEHYSVYFFKFNGKTSMLKFEPDAEFSAYINEKIVAALENADDEYDD